MACSDRINERYRDLDVVRILAKKAANSLSVDMKIYKTTCDGIQVYKFSPDWQGEVTETVQFDRTNSSNNILSNNEDWRQISTKDQVKKGSFTKNPK